MGASHILLGRPWQTDRRVVHNGFTNKHTFHFKGKKTTLVPLSPHEVYKDQVSMRQREHKARMEESSSSKGKRSETTARVLTSKDKGKELPNAEATQAKHGQGSKLQLSVVPKYSMLMDTNLAEPRLAKPNQIINTLQDHSEEGEQITYPIKTCAKPRNQWEDIAEQIRAKGWYHCVEQDEYRSKLEDMSMSPLSQALQLYSLGFKQKDEETHFEVTAPLQVNSAERCLGVYPGGGNNVEPVWEKGSDEKVPKDLRKLVEREGAERMSTQRYQALGHSPPRNTFKPPEVKQQQVSMGEVLATPQALGPFQVFDQLEEVQPSQIFKSLHLTKPTMSRFTFLDMEGDSAECEEFEVVGLETSNHTGGMDSKGLTTLLEAEDHEGSNIPESNQVITNNSSTAPPSTPGRTSKGATKPGVLPFQPPAEKRGVKGPTSRGSRLKTHHIPRTPSLQGTNAYHIGSLGKFSLSIINYTTHASLLCAVSLDLRANPFEEGGDDASMARTWNKELAKELGAKAWSLEQQGTRKAARTKEGSSLPRAHLASMQGISQAIQANALVIVQDPLGLTHWTYGPMPHA